MATPDESVRDMDQVRHTLETVQREVPSSQFASETQASSVRIVTPLYKLTEKKPNTEVHMGGGHGASEQLSGMNGDYKAQRSAEQFRMQIIDPKVNSNAHIPSQTGSLPNYGKKIVSDFPSQHGKRSLLKLDPLEQRRIRSVESRPITTSTYLTESVDRHREMEASKLRQFLKASEDDANKPWNKPAWPGHKPGDDTGESLREIELIRKKIESLQKRSMQRSQSLGELMLIPPSDKKGPQSEAKSSPTVDDGWLVKIRTHRYLENAKNRTPSRTRSVGDLSRTPKLSFASDRIHIQQILQEFDEKEYNNPGHPSKGGDELSWQLKKEFHLSKYTERRRSSFISESQHQQQTLSSHREYDSSRFQSDTPLSRQKRSNSQLLYPPGSIDQIASEHTTVQRPPEKVVYENKPLPPAVVSLNITQASSSSQQTRRFDRQPPPPRQPEDDYSERLMSPPPGRQTPKSILKQSYSQQQHYSDQEQSWEQSSHFSRQQTSNMSQPSYPSQGNEPGNRSVNQTPANYGSTYDLDDAEKYRIMQENLRKHREHRSFTPQNVPRYPTTSFNGPFFKLEEVTTSDGSDRPRSQSVAPVMNHETSQRQRFEEEMHFREQYNQYHYQQHQQMNQMKNISASEMELNKHNENAPTSDEGVVIWPPPPKKSERPRPASAMARSILDPERIEEFRKQKQREMEAMRRREERESYLQQRQLQAIQIQQQRLYEQRQQLISEQPQRVPYSSSQPQQIPIHNIPQIHTMSPSEEMMDKPIPQYTEDPGPPPPSQMRVFETRPISALSGEFVPDPRETMSPNTLNTWRRTYVVDKPPEVAAKNQILTSEELLEKESFAVDLLKRREAFIEKPEEEPEIFRTGKRWQPPPEKPYIWPTLRRPVTVEPGNEPTVNFAPGVPDDGEYKWQPVVFDPGYKKEKKNFTPTNSPPHSPRRGMGTGPLDDVAKRQTKYVIQPSPDGSHRPRPVFKPARHTPSGGFLPHAPNAVKIVKKRSTQIHNSLSPNFIDQGGEEVEVIHEKNFHRLEDIPSRQQTPSQARSRSLNIHSKTPINDWEKIYDLPPHSSTITNKDPPPNIDVRRRLQLFESQAQATLQRRAFSERRNSDSPQTVASTPKPQQHESSRRTNTPHRVPASNGGTLLRRVDSRTDTQQHHHHQSQHSQSHRHQRPVPRERSMTTSSAGGEPYSSKRASRSGTPQQHQHISYSQGSSSAMPQTIAQSLPAHRHDEPHHRPASTTSQKRLQRIIQATQPSPAPPSYERARPYVPPPLPPGYKAAQEPKKHDDLDELARKNQELAERSKNRRHDYKLVGSDIIKTDPEPLPTHFKEQIREMLESRISTDTSSINQQDRSGYVTDASSATWQFNNSFSPRSVVSLNGAKAEDVTGLLKVRTTTAPPEDDKPRSIMKRSQLDSREQMTYAEPERRIVRQHHSEVVQSKPRVTETVQRVEENKRTEEVERRIIRRERRHKSSRHRYGHGQQEYVDWQGDREINQGILKEVNENARRDATSYKIEANEAYERFHRKYAQGTQTQFQQQQQKSEKVPDTGLQRYNGRRYTADELNQAVRRAYQAVDKAYKDIRQWRSNSMQRGGYNGYLPAYESYHRSTSTRRDRDRDFGDFSNRYIDNRSGLAHARYGSLSDSLRRGELKYIPNGDFRENYSRSGRMHKSHSTRDVFHDSGRDSSWRRGSAGPAPFIEFPPTLPRSARGEPPMPPPHRGFSESNSVYRPVSKSRSYADWDSGRGPFGSSVRRYDDDMARLENEMRDSLLMPLPNGNMNEKDYRHEQIPGGHETYSRESKANSGRRLNREGVPTDFKEASQEYSFKREVQH